MYVCGTTPGRDTLWQFDCPICIPMCVGGPLGSLQSSLTTPQLGEETYFEFCYGFCLC